MNFKKLLSEKPFKYDSPHGIGATRNLWCHAKIKGDKKLRILLQAQEAELSVARSGGSCDGGAAAAAQ